MTPYFFFKSMALTQWPPIFLSISVTQSQWLVLLDPTPACWQKWLGSYCSNWSSSMQMSKILHFQAILQIDLSWPLTFICDLWRHEHVKVPLLHHINKPSWVPTPGGGTPMMNPQHVPVNRPPFLNCHYPDDPLFLLCWPILNSMTPFFCFSQVLNDPPHFYHFLLPNCPPFSSKSYYPMAHLFSLWHLYTCQCWTGIF